MNTWVWLGMGAVAMLAVAATVVGVASCMVSSMCSRMEERERERVSA